jgi:hypothetical protein
MVNAFPYSVYGQQGGERHTDSQPIIAYRHRWLDALLASGQVEAVVAFGHLAREAFERWLEPDQGGQAEVHFEHLTHPTMPEASSRNDPAKYAAAMKQMLGQWNTALRRLDDILGERDTQRELVHYGERLVPEDRAPIPGFDMPAGAPPWMRSVKEWATRKEHGRRQAGLHRVVVPRGERPWDSG